MKIKRVKLICNLINVSIAAKKKGHDIFMRYSPHVELIEADFYMGGWSVGKNLDLRISIYGSTENKEINIAIKKIKKILIDIKIRVDFI